MHTLPYQWQSVLNKQKSESLTVNINGFTHFESPEFANPPIRMLYVTNVSSIPSAFISSMQDNAPRISLATA